MLRQWEREQLGIPDLFDLDGFYLLSDGLPATLPHGVVTTQDAILFLVNHTTASIHIRDEDEYVVAVGRFACDLERDALIDIARAAFERAERGEGRILAVGGPVRSAETQPSLEARLQARQARRRQWTDMEVALLCIAVLIGSIGLGITIGLLWAA